jgi:hypothetical protein
MMVVELELMVAVLARFRATLPLPLRGPSFVDRFGILDNLEVVPRWRCSASNTKFHGFERA